MANVLTRSKIKGIEHVTLADFAEAAKILKMSMREALPEVAAMRARLSVDDTQMKAIMSIAAKLSDYY